MRYKITAAAVILYAAAACEGPLLPAASPWRPWVSFPDDAITSEVCEKEDSGLIYASATVPGETGSIAVIYESVFGTNLKEAFRSPYEPSGLYSLAYGAGVLWAAGTKTEGGRSVPHVVSYDDDRWREVAVPAAFNENPLTVVGCAGGAVYFSGDKGLYRYQGGRWEEVFDYQGHQLTTFDEFKAAVTEGGKVFISHYSNGFTNASKAFMYVSYDGGRTFAKEAFNLSDRYWQLNRYPYLKPAGKRCTSRRTSPVSTASRKTTTPRS